LSCQPRISFAASLKRGCDLPFANKVNPKGDRNTDTESNIGKTGDPVAPDFLFLESDRDDGEEDEGSEPSERDPARQKYTNIG
jgi:hypothetical protein